MTDRRPEPTITTEGAPMKRRNDEPEVEPHVFDQTNGMVDLGEDERRRPEPDRDADRRRTVGGIAMLSANRPAG